MKVSYLVYSLCLLILPSLFLAQEKDTVKSSSRMDTARVNITRLSVNTDKSDFSPLLIHKTLMFVSGRENNIGITYKKENSDEELTDLFYALKMDSILFKQVKPFPGEINTKYDEGPFTLNKSGTVMYFSANDKSLKNGNQKPKHLKIYRTTKVSVNTWGMPQLASFCDSSYNYCHPTISQDQTMIVFSSDRPGGYGGMDLYYSKYEHDAWTSPVNLGKEINTSHNEVFPYLSQLNELYFSSNKPSGSGGLDLYSVSLNDSIRSSAKHLSYPFNTSSDDFGICTDSTGESGYFSSNRLPAFKDDIYYFEAMLPSFSEFNDLVVKSKFCYTFFEELATETSDTANIVYEWDFGDGEKCRSVSCRHCFTKPGDYLIQLNVLDRKTGEIFSNEVNYTLTIEVPPTLIINHADTLKTRNELIFDSENSAIKGYQLTAFYWSFGDGKYNKGSKVKHRYEKSGTYTLELGVFAKSDATQKIEKFKIKRTITVND